MHKAAAIISSLLLAQSAFAQSNQTAVDQCLSCHKQADAAQIDIIGLRALSALPSEWQYLFEDEFDLDDNGVAGRLRFVSGPHVPLPGKFGQRLAAGRFEDFARIAGAAHGVDLSDRATLHAVQTTFEALSPDPDLPFESTAEQNAFEMRGCADCHVTRTFEHEGKTYMPLSDFLLHETDAGPRRTAPLWGCASCLDAATHVWLQKQTP
ncbi:MAG: hypothetical protein AAF307_13575 [Pseudomonadota bacterium]